MTKSYLDCMKRKCNNSDPIHPHPKEWGLLGSTELKIKKLKAQSFSGISMECDERATLGEEG